MTQGAVPSASKRPVCGQSHPACCLQYNKASRRGQHHRGGHFPGQVYVSLGNSDFAECIKQGRHGVKHTLRRGFQLNSLPRQMSAAAKMPNCHCCGLGCAQPDFAIFNDQSIFWYMPHRLGRMQEQVWRRLAILNFRSREAAAFKPRCKSRFSHRNRKALRRRTGGKAEGHPHGGQNRFNAGHGVKLADHCFQQSGTISGV